MSNTLVVPISTGGSGWRVWIEYDPNDYKGFHVMSRVEGESPKEVGVHFDMLDALNTHVDEIYRLFGMEKKRRKQESKEE